MSPAIRWLKGELIGHGAFGCVFKGMNLDSGELLAVKQLLVPANSASKEKTQAHIKEFEEEVKLLKDLSHPNIVRYLDTVREKSSLNILLEFVPGGSLSSLLKEFGPLSETVVRIYIKQLLFGLQYLHSNGIIHRDIKGANILLDAGGCIKIADFGTSKQLATFSGAKSFKGTVYFMAPEVILQTGHSFSADIWSVGCTVIEMVTGKPPWSQQYPEAAAAVFHIGRTKSHPPISDHLSVEAKDFLLNCFQEEPRKRPTASKLLKHPFVFGLQVEESHPISSSLFTEISEVPEISEIREISEIQEISKVQEIFSEVPEISEIREISEIQEISKVQEISEIPSSPSAFNLNSLQMRMDDPCNLRCSRRSKGWKMKMRIFTIVAKTALSVVWGDPIFVITASILMTE